MEEKKYATYKPFKVPTGYTNPKHAFSVMYEYNEHQAISWPNYIIYLAEQEGSTEKAYEIVLKDFDDLGVNKYPVVQFFADAKKIKDEEDKPKVIITDGHA